MSGHGRDSIPLLGPSPEAPEAIRPESKESQLLSISVLLCTLVRSLLLYYPTMSVPAKTAAERLHRAKAERIQRKQEARKAIEAEEKAAQEAKEEERKVKAEWKAEAEAARKAVEATTEATKKAKEDAKRARLPRRAQGCRRTTEEAESKDNARKRAEMSSSDPLTRPPKCARNRAGSAAKTPTPALSSEGKSAVRCDLAVMFGTLMKRNSARNA
jgi:hypothetical protein